ncbi:MULTISPECIES: chemotaxis response regulator protein-glutamate methylesterase [unclassified Neptuniibacter]|uniref:protein-glutamate methylesterase/protein-glutamine glutaminase n=1 Tax=unclassified Neptuniibacter TaxID=2630693 RepID=UPI000C4E72BB|nr:MULTISPECIES: chemotaxis response regulator protein-glutamate methylesterase [unclassified Neptuniibacter]MAY42437.1 chemotaxis response regulator protein-glutamate methylesterase [Oceanospirillaceae bacterium]|tara:strand:- start:10860 stop:11906 length:1047 start_codon:yes stop_codon:yes gene_type:complete
MDGIRVLIVDDSALVRNVLTELLSLDSSIEVVGTAVDPYDARDKIKLLKPDVVTLDIEMPRMDGITFLKNLMKLNPIPVVMISTLTHAGADATLQALELGAVDYIGKPTANESDEALKLFQRDLVDKVKAAAGSSSKLKFRRSLSNIDRPVIKPTSITHKNNQLIAIGSSTGGTEALHDLLSVLPGSMPPIIITQHIPESFSDRFANRLNRQSELSVSEAKEGDVLKAGHVYIAPGSHHLVIKKYGHQFICTLDSSEPVNRHKPSVEVMFDSLSELDAKNITTVLLTGMGEDGALAMKRLVDQGAYSIVQDEATSLVWGMPGAAVRLGAAKEVLALEKVAPRLVQYLS